MSDRVSAPSRGTASFLDRPQLVTDGDEPRGDLDLALSAVDIQ
jgi:hypothetical protein